MSSNFLDHNPTNSNQESDGTYATDITRTGGVAAGQLLSSPFLNKLWRQSSVMVAALADMLSTKTYSVSDASRTTLATVLANILTVRDRPSALKTAAPVSNTGNTANNTIFTITVNPTIVPASTTSRYRLTVWIELAALGAVSGTIQVFFGGNLMGQYVGINSINFRDFIKLELTGGCIGATNFQKWLAASFNTFGNAASAFSTASDITVPFNVIVKCQNGSNSDNLVFDFALLEFF